MLWQNNCRDHMWSYFLTGCTTAVWREWLWGIHDDGQWSYNWNAMVFVCSKCRFVDETLEIVFYFSVWPICDPGHTFWFCFSDFFFYCYFKKMDCDTNWNFMIKKLLLSLYYQSDMPIIRRWWCQQLLEAFPLAGYGQTTILWRKSPISSTQGVCNISWKKIFSVIFSSKSIQPNRARHNGGHPREQNTYM